MQRARTDNEISPQSAELFHLIVENIKDYAIFMTEADGRVASWNPGVERLLGYTESEIVGQPITIIFTPEDAATGAHLKEMKKAAAEGRAENKRWHQRRDGSRFWANGLVMPLKNGDGSLRGFAKVMRDDTTQKLAEEKLAQTSRHVENILENINDGFYALDREWRFTYINERAEPLIKRRRAELLGKNVWEEFPEVVGTLVYEQYHKAANERATVMFEEFYAPLETWFEIRVSPAPDGLSVYFHDITKRKRREANLAFLADLQRDFAHFVQVDEILRAAGARISEHLNLSGCVFVEIDEAAETADVFYEHPAAHPPRLIGKYPLGEFHTAEETKRLAAGEAVVINDVRDEPRTAQAAAKFETLGVRALTVSPYIGDGRWKFALSAQCEQPHQWRADEIELLNSLATRVYLRIERARAEESMRESEEQLRALADSIPQLTWMAEPDGFIFWYNRRWYEYTGTTSEEMAGWGWQTVHDGEMLPNVMKRWQTSIKTGEPFEMEFPLRCGADQTFRWFLTRVVPVLDANGRIIRWFGTNTDIEELRQTRLQAEQANNLKDEFLATLSHELRTPLNAILGWSQMLQTRRLGEDEAKKALATIERSARSQSQLIDDLLDVSRIITGKLRLDVRGVDLPNVITASVDAARPAAEAKNIRLQILLDPNAGPISGDPDRLQQIVWNLLSNAVKFTPKNGRVQVRLERVNSHIEIVISDTGKGIEAEFLPHVFDRFRQSDGSMTRRHGGLGLGLAIVRQLVELHGGTVSVSSAGANSGATFTVNLPLLPVRNEAASDAPRVHPAATDKDRATENNPSELADLRVLLVDDEADSRELLDLVLTSHGAQITVAASAAEAFEKIKSERFDIIVSDIGMPDEDGFSLIGKIRELPNASGGDTPAIALTAYARPEDRVQALRAGFQMHIAKPVEPNELIVTVANLAGRIKNPKV